MLLLWSGGADSTLLLHDMLTDKETYDGKVRTLAINHCQVPQRKNEVVARKAIKAELKKRKLVWQHVETSINNSYCQPNGGPGQAVAWLVFGVSHLEPDEDLYCGYVREDDIWHYRNLVINAFDDLRCLLHKKGEIKFPFEWDYKTEIKQRLKDASLHNLIWYCEYPKKNGSRCGRCKCCKRHNAA